MAGWAEDMRRPGMGEMGDLDHIMDHHDMDHKGKPEKGQAGTHLDKVEKAMRKAGDRKKRNKGRA